MSRDPGFDLENTDLTPFIEAAAGQPQPEMPRATGKPKVTMTLRMDPDVVLELVDAAKHRGVGHTTLAQELIVAGLASMRAEKTMVPLADVQRVIAQLAGRQDPAA